jgi:hypothetical protein
MRSNRLFTLKKHAVRYPQKARRKKGPDCIDERNAVPGPPPSKIIFRWPSSAIAAALLIRFPHLRCGWTALAVLAAFVVANMIAAHRPLALAALFGLVNATEIALMVLPFRFVKVFPYPMITISQAAVMTAVFGIAIPGLVAMIGGLLLHTPNSVCPALRARNLPRTRRFKPLTLKRMIGCARETSPRRAGASIKSCASRPRNPTSQRPCHTASSQRHWSRAFANTPQELPRFWHARKPVGS